MTDWTRQMADFAREPSDSQIDGKLRIGSKRQAAGARRGGGRRWWWWWWCTGGCRLEQGGNVKEVPQASARVTFEPIFSRASDYIIPLVGIKLGFGTVRRSDSRFYAASRTTLHLRSCRTVVTLSGCLISTISRAVDAFPSRERV